MVWAVAAMLAFGCATVSAHEGHEISETTARYLEPMVDGRTDGTRALSRRRTGPVFDVVGDASKSERAVVWQIVAMVNGALGMAA